MYYYINKYIHQKILTDSIKETNENIKDLKEDFPVCKD